MVVTYTYLIIFGCLAYLIITDESVAKAVYFISKIVQNQLSMIKWWVINNPRTPWRRYLMYRQSMKMAKELMKEFNNDNKNIH